jgi:arabinose-5-phosphate isomerase
MAASLASVGVPAHFVHGTEWVHGDLGAACAGDLVLSFSHSGNTEELAVLPGLLRRRGVTMGCVVGSADSALGNTSDHVVLAPAAEEILGKIPSRSIVAQEAVVNAIVAEVVRARSFALSDFVINHPGGSIGKARVDT